MSQLPWGGKPDSPTNDVSGTGQPGQGADAGPDARDKECDCVCTNYGEQPWIPPGGGPGGDPTYTGTYLKLIRCEDDAPQPVWVQSNEFSAGDVLLIESSKTGQRQCFYVGEDEINNGLVPDTNVIRPEDVEAEYATCAACGNDPTISGPKTNDPPIPATSYAQFAYCEDDTLAPYWTPVEVYGQPVNEDLTKVYEYQNVCYYVSNNIQDLPEDPLLPILDATVHDDCGGCACAGCLSASACGNCTGCTPDTIQLVVSGITSCCYSAFGDGYEFDLANINATHTLTQNSACGWSKSVAANSQNYSVWSSDTTCTGAPTSTIQGATFSVYIDRTAAGWEVEIIASINGFNVDFILFKGSVAETADGNCGEIAAITNDYAVGDCNTSGADLGLTNGGPNSDVVAGYGGSVAGSVCP